MVYDLTDRPSFNRIRQRMKEPWKMASNGNQLCLTIVSKKADLQRGGGSKGRSMGVSGW